MKVAIIGAGPSGMLAASKIKGEVHVFDKNSDSGKKLLLTGNGKCNYWNLNQDISKYHSTNEEILKKIINTSNLDKTFNYLTELGIVTKVKNDYCYPYSETASSVKEILKKACLLNNVIFHFDTDINSVTYENNHFLVNQEIFDKVVIATGGMSASKTGCTGFGYEVAKSFNHHIIPLNPSLVQLVTNTNLEKLWKGIRSSTIASIYQNGKILKAEEGEVQFTEYGLSGICIFNLSRIAKDSLNKNQIPEIHLNFVPWCKIDFLEYLETRNKLLPNRNLLELCDGFLNYKVLMFILKRLNISYNLSWSDLSKEQKIKLASSLTDFTIIVADTKGFDNAQVTSGGINLSEINPETLESKFQKGLYFCGEVLDIDGDCGGYNLAASFTTAFIVGDYL